MAPDGHLGDPAPDSIVLALEPEPISTMWEPLARARRRLLGDDPSPGLLPDLGDEPAADITYALGKPELERLIGALADAGTPESGRPDTPARLEAALHDAIARIAGHGLPVVTRRPAGVYTPETWHISVVAADTRTRAMLDRAIRGGGLA